MVLSCSCRSNRFQNFQSCGVSSHRNKCIILIVRVKWNYNKVCDVEFEFEPLTSDPKEVVESTITFIELINEILEERFPDEEKEL